MRARDIMTQPVTTVAPDASIFEAIRIMLQNKISGLPVVNAAGTLIGMITEGDFLRRSETATQRRRPRWIEFVLGPGRLADEYVQASGRKVSEIMTSEVHTVTEDAPLVEVVELMERYRVKRIPVLRGSSLIGIITRANLMWALAHTAKLHPLASGDAAIRDRVVAEINTQRWVSAETIHIAVRDGIVTLSGILTDERQRQALCVAAENIPGVRKVEDQMAWLVPGTGALGPPVIVGPSETAN
jgi:CBS domain-containing protein